MNNGEYLVNYNGTWFVARAGVVKAPHWENTANTPGEEDVLQLCWCERNGSVICLAHDETEVRALPE